MFAVSGCTVACLHLKQEAGAFAGSRTYTLKPFSYVTG